MKKCFESSGFCPAKNIHLKPNYLNFKVLEIIFPKPRCRPCLCGHTVRMCLSLHNSPLNVVLDRQRPDSKMSKLEKILAFFLSNSWGDKHPLAMKPAEFKLIMNTSRSAEACAVEIKGSNRQVSPCHFKEEVSCEIVKS